MLKVPMAQDELRILLLVIENEKTTLLQSLKDFMPPNTQIPNILHLKSLQLQDTRNKPITIYSPHPEFPRNFPPQPAPPLPNDALQPRIIVHNTILNDQPQQPSTNVSEPVINDQTTFSPILNFNDISPPQVRQTILNRRKRNIATPFFSFITGLAAQEDITKLTNNEHDILKAETILADRVQALQTQSSSVLQNIKDQNEKLSVLYKDELEIKTSLRSLLVDTNNAMTQISQLIAGIGFLVMLLQSTLRISH
jgi:hypothetical protein